MERLPLTREEFVHLWTSVTSLAEISRQTGMSNERLYAFAEQYGLPARPRGVRKPKQVDVPLLFKLWQEPIEIREIAERLGVGESYVGKLARRYKLPKRATEKPVDNGMRVDDPTPEQIAERAAWCRSRRGETEQAKPVDIRAYHYDDRTGLYTGIESWAV